MKSKVHPQFYKDAKVTCSCGNTFTTGSTKQSISVEVCHKCHPLYTGEHRLVDTKGRVGAFEKKKEAAKQFQARPKKAKKEEKGENRPKTLRELLGEV